MISAADFPEVFSRATHQETYCERRVKSERPTRSLGMLLTDDDGIARWEDDGGKCIKRIYGYTPSSKDVVYSVVPDADPFVTGILSPATSALAFCEAATIMVSACHPIRYLLHFRRRP